MKEVKLVFWDWVGTLYSKDVHSSLYLNNAFNQGFLSEDLDVNNLSLEQQNEIRNIFLKYRSRKVLYTWFLVEKFLSLGVFQVVVSNGVIRNIKNELRSVDPFDMILTSESFSPKPDISMFEYAINKLRVVDKESIIMIGDSDNDLLAAENLGIAFYKIEDYFFSVLKIVKDFNLF